MIVPLVTANESVTLSVEGNPGSASETPLIARLVPVLTANGPDGAVIASGPTTANDTLLDLLLPAGSLAETARVSCAAEATGGRVGQTAGAGKRGVDRGQ